MFFFKDAQTRMREREEDLKLLKELEGKEKPKFKDLVAIMFAQYLILIPMAVIGLAIFGFILYIFTKFIS
ncbi:MAG: hypothetical protein ACRCWM_01270 [Sarcina sp.]